MGLLTGPAFSVTTLLLVVPCGWIADRYSRILLLTVSFSFFFLSFSPFLQKLLTLNILCHSLFKLFSFSLSGWSHHLVHSHISECHITVLLAASHLPHPPRNRPICRQSCCLLLHLRPLCEWAVSLSLVLHVHDLHRTSLRSCVWRFESSYLVEKCVFDLRDPRPCVGRSFHFDCERPWERNEWVARGEKKKALSAPPTLY